MLTAITAFILDALVGEPRGKYHPVALIGNFIAWLEKRLYREHDTDNEKFIKGAAVVLIILAVVYAVATVLEYISYRLPWRWGTSLVSAIILYFTISPRMLADVGRELYMLLAGDKIELAREKVGYIVGRDTAQLTESEIVRATVETIAENTVDGVIAPLFFFIIGGAPLAALYRAANTLDSMLGYKNEKYLYFGRAAAKLDDVLGYIPARITGILFVMAAALLGYDSRYAWFIMQRDAGKHPSPNGGYAEAPVAGALHIRLGGENYYFGEPSFRAYMGEPLVEIIPKHILGSIRLMYTATIIFLLCAYVISLGLR